MINDDASGFDENVVPATIGRHYFEYLYKTWWKKVFGVIYHYINDKEVAAELAQELFADIWEKRATLIIRKDISSYLLRAAKLEAFDYLRTIARHKQLLDAFTGSTDHLQNTTEETILSNELHERLNLLIGQLPQRCREVYGLSQQQGMSRGAIALKLSISEKTVEYHLYKAMAYLRESLRLEKY